MVDQIKSSEGDYGITHKGEKSDDRPTGHFWERVKRALDAVFGKDPDLADAVRQRVEQAPANTQTAFITPTRLKSPPISSASGRSHPSRSQREVTPEQMRRYIETEGRQDRPSGAALPQRHPELREE